MPLADSTCLAIALSIASAEPSTPEPTYGTLASSSRPCTVPSSPIGPCSNGTTTVCVALGDHVGGHRLRCRSGRGGPAAPAAQTPARRVRPRRSPTCRRGRCPTGVMSYLSGSAARSTCAAVVQLTSCSADWPPNNTTSLIRSPVAMSPRRYRVGRCDSGQAMSPRQPAVDWSGPTSTSTAQVSTPARCDPVSCSCRSSPSATVTISSTTRCDAGAAAYLTSRRRSRWHGDRGGRHAARADGPRCTVAGDRSPAP